MLNVIMAVFLRHSNKCAEAIDEFYLSQRRKESDAFTIKMVEMFKELDVSGDGCLSREEFAAIEDHELVVAWMHKLEISTRDIQGLFEALDGGDGDGIITLDEFVAGVRRLKGEATAVDVMTIMSLLRRLGRDIQPFTAPRGTCV